MATLQERAAVSCVSRLARVNIFSYLYPTV